MNHLLKNCLVIYGLLQGVFSSYANCNLPTNFKINILKDSQFSLNVDTVACILKDNASRFIPIEKINFTLNNKANYWFYIQNNCTNNNTIYILTINERLSQIEVFPYPYTKASGRSGLLAPASNKQLLGGKVILEPNKPGYLVKVQNHFNTFFRVQNINIETLQVYQKKEVLQNVLQGIFQGFFWLMLIYNLLLLIMSKNTLHLYYVIYIFFNSLFLLFTFGYSEIYLFPNNLYINLSLLSFQLMGVFFYVLFLRKAMLSHCADYTAKKDRFLFHFLAYFVLVCNSIIASTIFYRMDIYTIASSISNVISTIVGIVIFLYYYKKSDRFLHLIMLGSVILFVFGYVNVAVSIFKKQTEIFYESGLLIELLILTYALNKQYFIEKRNVEKMKASLAAELEIKNRELVFTAIQLTAKENAILSIQDTLKNTDHPGQNNQMLSLLEYSHSANRNLWNEFEKHFNEIHPNFYKNISEKYPLLTQSEVRLCAFMKLNLNTKEIACITQKSVHSIETMRSRIRQKLQLARDENFTYIISQL